MVYDGVSVMSNYRIKLNFNEFYIVFDLAYFSLRLFVQCKIFKIINEVSIPKTKAAIAGPRQPHARH